MIFVFIKNLFNVLKVKQFTEKLPKSVKTRTFIMPIIFFYEV